MEDTVVVLKHDQIKFATSAQRPNQATESSFEDTHNSLPGK